MTAEDPVLDRLRRALVADRSTRDDCPDDDALWRFAGGHLGADETARIADHLPRCSTCVLAVRLARELGETPTQRAVNRTSTRRIASMGAVAAAAAAVLVWLGMRPGPDPIETPTIYRGATPAELAPIDDRPLSARDAVLRWHPGPTGTRYDVFVSDENLDEIAVAYDLVEPEFRVPAPVAGSVVLWRVEARLPDGMLVVSSTWTTRVE